jgi:hypothetical protein
MTTTELLAEIRRAIEEVEIWKPQQSGDLAVHGAMSYEGDSPDGWRFLIVVWPEKVLDENTKNTVVDRWKYIGTATKAPMIVKLTPELAELAAKKSANKH